MVVLEDINILYSVTEITQWICFLRSRGDYSWLRNEINCFPCKQKQKGIILLEHFMQINSIFDLGFILKDYSFMELKHKK